MRKFHLNLAILAILAVIAGLIEVNGRPVANSGRGAAHRPLAAEKWQPVSSSLQHLTGAGSFGTGGRAETTEMAQSVSGAGACCTETNCLPAATEAECTALGGVFLPGQDCANNPCAAGACCSETSCVQMAAFPCITSGRTFAGAGISCLSDPCKTGVGACCLEDGNCISISLEQCDVFGGKWLGPGAQCATGPCELGACCLPGQCLQLTQYQCMNQGGAFVGGGDCAADACDQALSCSLDSLYTQVPDQPGAFTAYVSEIGAFQRYDNYAAVAGAIDRLVWFGLDLQFAGSGFIECAETDPTFQISFHEDVAGLPGPAACSFILLATRTPTGMSYGGAELNRYEVVLDQPCVLIDGWISITGMGDPACWFLWMSAPDGDGFSYCSGCQSPQQGDDLSFCIGGPFGGIFGACCDETTGACSENVEITNCIGSGLRFAPDQACAALSPPCAIVTGACCNGELPCTIITELECANAGGTWLGASSTCGGCPVVAACCMGFGECSMETQFACESKNGLWLGADSGCSDCPGPPTCEKDSLFAQPPDGPDGFTAGTSEVDPNLRRYENFSGVGGAIESLTWWGLDLDYLGGNEFAECTELDPTFEISFHEDAGGAPGRMVCSYTLLATREELGLLYLGATLNRYSAKLPQSCTLVNGWVSIVGTGHPDCWFLWMSAGVGESWCENCLPPQQSLDLSVCLNGTLGGIFGACCNDSSGECKDNVEITKCLNADTRFSPNQSCADLSQPCGVIVGACCMNDATCQILTQAQCAQRKGNWLGANTLCAQCPCLTPCPPGALAEGEPTCGDDYLDVLNGGCLAKTQAFSPIQLGDVICGTSGVFHSDGEDLPEYDWYQVNVADFTELHWSVQAEFRPRLWIVDANAGCPGNVLATDAAFECDELAISALVPPGVYWLVIAPAGFTDSAACGTHYVASLNPTSSCPADISPPNGDGMVDVDDLLLIINNWGKGSGPADITGDGTVDVDDLLLIINNWGSC